DEYCSLGSSYPIYPDSVCWALACCERCRASAGGGDCWAAEMPTLPANASAKAPVRKRSRRMIASISFGVRDATCRPMDCPNAVRRRTRAAKYFGGRFYRHNRRSGALVSMPRGRGGNYFAAYKRWPKAKITLRQGGRVVEKN